MAERDQKWPENAAGRYYVDEACIASRYCISAAPNNFRMADDGHAYVFRQPATPEEEEQCRDACQGCPVAAIGEDGISK